MEKTLLSVVYAAYTCEKTQGALPLNTDKEPDLRSHLWVEQFIIHFKNSIMNQSDRIFKKSFRKHFSNHEANFPPSRQIAVGDFGTMDNGFFTRLGNIKNNFNINFDVLPDDNPSHEEFKSEGDVSITFYAKGDVKPGGTPLLKAQIDFSFSSKHSFYFSSAEVKYFQISDMLEVGKKIVELYQQGKWQKKWVLVSTLLQGTNAIIIISGSSNAGLTIEADSDEIKQIDLANASIKLGIKSSSSVAYQIVTPAICQIGFGLSRVYNPLFRQPVFKISEYASDAYARLDHDIKQPVVFGDVPTNIYDEV